jgi:hypothetical protein
MQRDPPPRVDEVQRLIAEVRRLHDQVAELVKRMRAERSAERFPTPNSSSNLKQSDDQT